MVSTPELKKYLGKQINVTLDGNRKIRGLLAGYDMFLNLNMDECVQLTPIKRKRKSENDEPNYTTINIGHCVIRGNSIVSFQPVS